MVTAGVGKLSERVAVQSVYLMRQAPASVIAGYRFLVETGDPTRASDQPAPSSGTGCVANGGGGAAGDSFGRLRGGGVDFGASSIGAVSISKLQSMLLMTFPKTTSHVAGPIRSEFSPPEFRKRKSV